MRKQIAFILCLFLYVIPFNAEAQRAVRSIDRDTLGTGDVFHFSLRVTGVERFTDVVYPDSSAFGSDLILRDMQVYPLPDGDSLVYRLQLFGIDIHHVPEMQLSLIDRGDTLNMIIPSTDFFYKSRVDDDRADLRPLKPIFPFFRDNWILYISVILALLLILLLIYLFRERLFGRYETEEVESIPVIPFHNPLDKLNKEIKQLEMILQNPGFNVKVYYSRLSDTLRDYYEQVHGFPALESTTSEVVEELKRRAFDKEVILLTAHILQEADLVKFARFHPGKQACHTVLKHAKTLASRLSTKDLYRIGELRQQHDLIQQEQQST